MARPITLFVFLLLTWVRANGQQDVDFHLNAQFLTGKTILKVKRDFNDPYLWVLAKNNELYRINSQTKAVDNYTTIFNSYSTEFIDIAGRGKDTVFIATKSADVIQYAAGKLSLIDATVKGPDTVTSVGVDYTGRLYRTDNYHFGHVLLIGTVKGMYRYDMDAGTATPGSDPIYSKVFETSYRRDIFSGINDATYTDTLTYYPVEYNYAQTTFTQFVWLNNTTYGSKLNTVFYVPYGFDDYNFVEAENLFYGTEKGLTQLNGNLSFSTAWPGQHYLNNIQVNKITDVFGLASFVNDQAVGTAILVKQNLLVGTDQGLYFSNSLYNNFQQVGGYSIGLRSMSLFHYDELGNVRVNDICTNMASDWPVICEDGVWIACDNGLYLIKPDYAKYINSQQSHVIAFKNLSDTISSVKICSGTSITAAVNLNMPDANAIQWYKDGVEIPAASADTLQVNTAGDYYTVLYDPCENIHIESNHLKVQVISSPVFSFNYPDKLQYCDSTQTTLKTDNNPGYHYRWYTNGALNGDTTYNYTVTQNGKFKVEVSACTNSWVPSKEIEVDLINLPVAVVSADKPKYCAGEQAVLTVNAPADPDYTISWFKDGSILEADQDKSSVNVSDDGNYSVQIVSKIAGCAKTSNSQQVSFTPAPAFAFNYPDKLVYCNGTPTSLLVSGSSSYQYRWYLNGNLDGNVLQTENVVKSGKYKVEVSSCDGSWVPSKEVQVNLISIPLPVVKTDKSAYCIGDNATLSLSVPTDPAYTINWYKDNNLLNVYTNQTSITTNVAGNYSVTITSNETNTDGTICSQISAMQPIVFNPLPTLTIQKIVKTTLCDGQTVDLKVSYSDGTVKWSTGDNSDQISVMQSGTFSAIITSATGCTSSASVDVQFFPNPVLALPNAGVCVRSHKTATLTAPAGMVSYVWNGQTGDKTYVVNHPQTVTLTVTDANGCTATQDILVSDECPDIVVPNAFTPNGDGINDTWIIKGLEYDATAIVRIFTRNGQQIFESHGYNKPWDGTYKGKLVPGGTYYYVISASHSTQTYSGYVAVLY